MTLPKRIDCYQVVEHSTSGDAFKLDPARLIYSLLWKHNDGPAAGGGGAVRRRQRGVFHRR